MPVGTFPRLTDVQPGFPLGVSYQCLCHQKKKGSLSSLLRDKTSIMTDEACRPISLRTAGSLLKNLMDIKRLGWKADRSKHMENLFSLYYQCKKNCSRPKEAACLEFVFSKGCHVWFGS